MRALPGEFMSLLSGPISLTRYNVISLPEELDFESAEFEEIMPSSEVRKRQGFLPMEPGAPYEIAGGKWAFRIRMDTRTPDSTRVRERLKSLLALEMEESGRPWVGSKKRKEMKNLAEEELLMETAPRTKIIEGCLDSKVIYVGSTTKADVGVAMELLRRIGVQGELKTPWADRQQADFDSDILEIFEPGASILGCRFLRELMGDNDLTFEPVSGNVRLKTREATVTINGAILTELYRLVERDAEVVSGKLLAADYALRLDGPTFQISGLRVTTGRHDSWIEQFDERMERIEDVFEKLEAKYDELFSNFG